MRFKLETILKKYNIENITHGIAYNISDLSQIKYWDKTGQEIVVSFNTSELSPGIFCFRIADGSITIL